VPIVLATVTSSEPRMRAFHRKNRIVRRLESAVQKKTLIWRASTRPGADLKPGSARSYRDITATPPSR
jgi:hypothetical protein